MNHPLGRIGYAGLGLDAYWPQFPGLKSQLESYARAVTSQITAAGAEVVDLGLVDSPEAARTSLVLDRMVPKKKLVSLAYHYMLSGIPENRLKLVVAEGESIAVC